MKIPLDAITPTQLYFEVEMITATMGVQEYSIGFDAGLKCYVLNLEG